MSSQLEVVVNPAWATFNKPHQMHARACSVAVSVAWAVAFVVLDFCR